MSLLRYPLIVIIATTLLFCSCGKDWNKPASCQDIKAANFQKIGRCTYPRELVLGDYSMTVTKYTLEPRQVGTQFIMSVRNGSYGADSVVEVDMLNGLFNPYDFYMTLHGYSFTFALTSGMTWSGGPITGTGTFKNDSLTFIGIVHSSGGDSAVVMQGVR